jgi:hypothetical protein
MSLKVRPKGSRVGLRSAYGISGDRTHLQGGAPSADTEQSSLMICVFAADITDEFLIVLDVQRTSDVSLHFRSYVPRLE